MSEESTTLLRTHYIDDHVRAFLQRLASESRHNVAVVADERGGELDIGGFKKYP